MPENQVALVTGGTRGIGLGIAEALLQEGLDLALCGVRPPEAVAELVARLQAQGRQVAYFQADVARSADRTRLVEAVQQRFGRLHVLVNNAGIAPPVRADLLEASEESFDQVLAVNLKGPYFLTQQVARWMIHQRQQNPSYQGTIVNIGSISATVVSVNRGEYCVSKAGLAMATQLWAVRLAEFGIRVYEVRPGIIQTDMTAPVRDKYDRLLAQGLCLQARWGQPEDIGRAVAMLVRGELPYSPGQVLLVDGGLTIPRL
ncbi:MAG: 3-ketoacyl-ACP reductase [Thermoguttaceae bacterium]|nr:3-ketoacyl-ACP reductase [Thermoguttaceae bacterium]MDW8039589.1 3-ketoacyl-ACP reductase [Thermoguttaceae bacterium]